ncbi:translation initiation factor IF-2 [Candidatus Peregrinibacteria bacterium]|nr:translation initiation factor IF-2 [Candidatus Peregrinibacteria bacterium]
MNYINFYRFFSFNFLFLVPKKTTATKKSTTKKTSAVKKQGNFAKPKAEKAPKKTTATATKKVEETKVKEQTDDDLFGDLNSPRDAADLHEEIVAKQLERELIKSQRKQTAGKADKKKQQFQTVRPQGPITDRPVEIPEVITVKEFSEKTNIGAAKVIGELMKNGILANINQQIDFETATIIAADFNVLLKKKQSEASAEDVYKGDLGALVKEDDPGNLRERPPIVVVMGHVDHGKTSILDYIREANVVKGEAGGITQHIGAYQVEKNGRKITFLDTPGHEAFTAMRARGAKVTDIAILVVAADEGIKPQTIEALQHGKEAGVPMIVAINKIDKEGADPDRVKAELGEYELVPEEWGGSTIMVPVSAHTGQGMDQLLDMILLAADLENLKANPNRPAIGTVIESHLDKNLGPVCTVVVNTGTLRLMDNIVVGSTYGRVKAMKDHTGKNVRLADPSYPVLIAGLQSTPQSGDIFHVVPDDKTARTQAQNVATLKEAELLSKRGMGEIISQISSGQLKQLKLVLKADTKGSLEALKESIHEIKNEDVGVKIILSGVGNITESDVMMAAAGGGIVMGFHTGITPNVKKIAERENIEVLHYNIIYKLLDDITKILTGMLEPEEIETVVGTAIVKQIFMTKKKEMIVGCKVEKGQLEKVKVRIYRNEELQGEGRINGLKRVDKEVKEVPENQECGVLYSGEVFPLQEGDIIEAYKMEKRIRTL